MVSTGAGSQDGWPAFAIVLLTVLGGLLAACSYATPQRTPPVGSLPDPAVLLSGPDLVAIFRGYPSPPACRYAESQYRCTWTDTANPARQLTVTIWADPARARTVIAGGDVQPVTLPGANEAATIVGDGEVVVWSVVNERGLEVSWSPDDPGNEAAHVLAATGLAGTLTTILAP